MEQFLPEETTKRLGVLLAQTLIDGIQSSISRPSMELLRRVFLITERYGDLDRVRRWTKSELTKDGTFIRPLISLMMQGLYSGGERDQEWPGDKEALRKVRAYTDAKWLAETFSPEQPAKQSRWTARITDEEAVFRMLQLLKHPVCDDPEAADSIGSS